LSKWGSGSHCGTPVQQEWFNSGTPPALVLTVVLPDMPSLNASAFSIRPATPETSFLESDVYVQADAALCRPVS
jgi:hypothetical protein